MTMRSNKAIVNAAGQTITTAGLAAGGALNPEQAKKFIQQTFEATPLSGLVRHELRSAKTGEIDKIGVGRRLLRKKTENTDDGYRSGVKLAGGTNVTSANGDVTAFVDKMEGIKFNTLCFPVTDATLQTAAITKIKYMRESMGKGVNVVLPDAKSPDHEGVINVTNSVVVDDVELTHAEACAFVAGITASASCIKSNTYEVYNGATGIVDPKDNEAAIAAIKNGEMFFSYSEAGNVIIEYDINSLVSFKKPKDKTYSKNRVIRTLDAIQETIQNNFPPNKYDNSPTGYAVMKGIGQTILKQYEDMGAIKNVDYDADFKIDESLSSGDEVYFIVAIQPVDSAEKLFFTVKTR